MVGRFMTPSTPTISTDSASQLAHQQLWNASHHIAGERGTTTFEQLDETITNISPCVGRKPAHGQPWVTRHHFHFSLVERADSIEYSLDTAIMQYDSIDIVEELSPVCC